MDRQTALVIGAGPAGLAAAYELASRTDIHPIVVEADDIVGGIARTVVHNGNRIDIGGHRFFSKSDRVMEWWSRMLPLQALPEGAGGGLTLRFQNQSRSLSAQQDGPDPDRTDEVMLVRDRVSRIYFGRKMYDYPLRFSKATFGNLGLGRTARILRSYAAARLKPIRPETTLRDFLVNRFGQELYATFFRDYTEKVWGVACEDIPADWGRQRIKGVSISGLISNMLRRTFSRRRGDLAQNDVETSLIEHFLYPKLGPGQLWEVVARRMQEAGGELRMKTRVVGLSHEGGRLLSVRIALPDGGTEEIAADYVFSTMPVPELLRGLSPAAPAAVREIADGLSFRDFMTVGLLVRKLTLAGGTTAAELSRKVPDNWIYIQEPDVRLGRLQIFNNWSPYLVADPDTVWLGLEYFVNEGDDLWSMDDAGMIRFGLEELEQLGIVDPADLLDGVVVRMKKTYPAYFGAYDRFGEVQDYLQGIPNLYCIGRNGMHRYNNQDHSILTAMIAVDGLAEGRDRRHELWEVNTEQDYHEEK